MKNRYVVLFVLTWLTAVVFAAANKKFTLVIDAGHGGHDAGAIGVITKEKTINLQVALAFGRQVERNCPDVKVIYTRKTDVFVPLHQRADIANRNKADLFISIHTNALPRGRISRGMETYTLGMHRAADNLDVAKRENSVILIEKDYKQHYEGFDPNSAESYIMFEFMQDHNMAHSVELAKFVQKRTCKAAGRLDKGVKQAGFLVLRETSMPSCLIELGFISTADEERYLASAEGVKQLGKGIFQAFADYKRKYDTNISVPLKAEPVKDVQVPSIVPQETVKTEKEKKKNKKSKVAQELADALDDKQPVTEEQTSPLAPADVDSIVNAAPVVDVTPAASKASSMIPESNASSTSAPVSNTSSSSTPVFKLQILASSGKLKSGDARLKGEQQVDYYQEGGLYKYTVGASENYQTIYQLRKQLLAKFPEAFIIAFKDGKKMDVRIAIEEYKKASVSNKAGSSPNKNKK